MASLWRSARNASFPRATLAPSVTSTIPSRHYATLPTSTLTQLPSKPVSQTREYQLYVKSSRNNTIMTFYGRNEKKNVQGTIFNVSGGTAGFKKVQRSGYEAGYQCAVKMFQRIAEEKNIVGVPMSIHLLFNGFGQGREAMFRALTASDGEIVRMMINRITDRTPIKIGGTRAKKRRVL